jgi:hypothetical protein
MKTCRESFPLKTTVLLLNILTLNFNNTYAMLILLPAFNYFDSFLFLLDYLSCVITESLTVTSVIAYCSPCICEFSFDIVDSAYSRSCTNID